MATSKPMLGDLELQQVQKIEIDEDQAVAQQSVPALEGDFLQRLGRRASQIGLTGVLTGPEAGAGLKTLQEKFRAAESVSFVADIATATKVDSVLIEELGMRELAGKPERFEYALTLREFVPPPKSEAEKPQIEQQIREDGQKQSDQQVDEITRNAGRLSVRVNLANGLQDYTGIVVLVEGTTESGDRLSFTIEDQVDGVYTKTDIPSGDYTARAVRR